MCVLPSPYPGPRSAALETLVRFLCYLEPRKGFAITNADNNRFIVRDGMVVDKDFAEFGAGDKEPVGRHHAHLALNLHLLPIPKNAPASSMSIETAQQVVKEPNFAQSVRSLSEECSMRSTRWI